jgi:hypothetical protein
VDESRFTDTGSGAISDDLRFVPEVVLVEIFGFGDEFDKSGGGSMVNIFAGFVTAASFGMSKRFRGITKGTNILRVAVGRMRGNSGIQLLVFGPCSFHSQTCSYIGKLKHNQ